MTARARRKCRGQCLQQPFAADSVCDASFSCVAVVRFACAVRADAVRADAVRAAAAWSQWAADAAALAALGVAFRDRAEAACSAASLVRAAADFMLAQQAMGASGAAADFISVQQDPPAAGVAAGACDGAAVFEAQHAIP